MGKKFFDLETYVHDTTKMRHKASPELLINHQPDDFREYFVKMIPHMRFTMFNTLYRKDPKMEYLNEICHMYDYFMYVGTYGLPRWQTYDISCYGKQDWNYFKFFINHVRFQCQSMNSKPDSSLVDNYIEVNEYEYKVNDSGKTIRVAKKDENGNNIKHRVYVKSAVDSLKNETVSSGKLSLDQVPASEVTIESSIEAKDLINKIKLFALKNYPVDITKKKYETNIGLVISDLFEGYDKKTVAKRYKLKLNTLNDWLTRFYGTLKESKFL